GMQRRAYGWAALGFLLGCGALARAQPAAGADPSFYRYRGENGRVVYTNIEEQVPLGQREDARLDLSHISLNTELGNELARRFEVRHGELTRTPFCAQARAEGSKDFLAVLWDDYG